MCVRVCVDIGCMNILVLIGACMHLHYRMCPGLE